MTGDITETSICFRVYTSTTQGWNTFLNSEQSEFILWNQDVVVSVSYRTLRGSHLVCVGGIPVPDGLPILLQVFRYLKRSDFYNISSQILLHLWFLFPLLSAFLRRRSVKLGGLLFDIWGSKPRIGPACLNLTDKITGGFCDLFLFISERAEF